MRLRSGAALGAGAPCAAALPHEVLVRIFSSLPRGALAVTPGRVSRAWAAAKAEAWAASQPAGDPDADVHPFCASADPDQAIPFLPAWYLRQTYGGASYKAQSMMRWVVAKHGLMGFATEVLDPRDMLHDTCAYHLAARFGQLPLLRWLDAYYHTDYRGHGPWLSQSVCCAAAQGGQLETLIWLRERSLPWHDYVTEYLFNLAAESGSLRVMEWCYKQGFPMGPATCAAAARGGQRDAIVFLRERGIRLGR